MGNSASSGRGHHEDTVDFGYLSPQGIYTGPRDWNQNVVAQLICERKLAPFYRPLEDYDESWDDDQILAHRKETQSEVEGAPAEPSSSRADSASLASKSSHRRGHVNSTSREIRHPEAAIYKGAVECPICFLFYPPNINHSRCCDQAICTECFVQIKRAEPDPKHLVSEPASCPYCVRENFGVVYAPPPWRTGLGSEGAPSPTWSDYSKPSEASPTAAMKRPRKSFSADSPEVVTIDQIRPDWEAKLAAVRAAVARRANRRIIMRQVGDRLIPVGISSGRVHPLPTEEAQIEGAEGAPDRGSRRSRRRQQNQDFNQLLGTMGLGGQDLEELMVMEAMRLSLLDHEDQQRRQREEEEKKKAQGGNGAAGSASTESNVAGAGPSSSLIGTSESSTLSPPPAESASASSTSVPTTSAHASTPSVTITSHVEGESPDVHTDEDSPLASASSVAHALQAPNISVDSDSTSPSPDSTDLPDAAHDTAVNSPASEEDAPGPQTPASAEPQDTPASSAQLHTSETRPVSFHRQDSLASSFGPSLEASNYDVLSSSPDSAISHKPLLRSRPGTPSVVAVNAADSSTAGAN